jgi:hypothetical protein
MNKTTGKTSILGRISKRDYTIIGAVILAIGIVHFSLQVFFIQKENLQAVETAVAENEPETAPVIAAAPEKRVITIEPEQFEIKKIKIITLPEIVKAPPVRQKEFVRAGRSVKKKEVKRETRAERLRRAERILTGV